MHFLNYFYFILFFTHIPFALSKKQQFPNEFERCARDDPQLDECLKRAVQNAVPQLVKGIPRVGIIPIDPLETTKIEMLQDVGELRLNLTLLNLITRGSSGAIIKRAHADIDKYILSFTVLYPKISMEGGYSMKAKTFFGPIEGNGGFYIILEGMQTKVDIIGEPEIRQGEEYLKIKRVPVDISITKVNLDFKNLFSGNSVIGKQINWLINRYWKRLYEQVKNLSESTHGEIIASLAQPFFDRVPYQQLYS